EVWKFHLQDRRLQFIEPKISADKLMMITRLHPMLATRPDARRQIFVVADDRARIPCGPEIFGRIKTETSDVTDCASRSRAESLRTARADRLGRILNH